MADEYQANDLSLEYISKLGQIDNQKGYVLKDMLVSSQESFIIKKNRLNLKESQQ